MKNNWQQKEYMSSTKNKKNNDLGWKETKNYTCGGLRLKNVILNDFEKERDGYTFLQEKKKGFIELRRQTKILDDKTVVLKQGNL